MFRARARNSDSPRTTLESSRASCAVFDSIIRDTFKRIPFVVPECKLIELFTEHATPLLQQIDRLSQTVRRLEDERDLLLPRLMSGKISLAVA